MRTKVYVVTMYRWGDKEKHSYVLGVYTTKVKAEKAGERERVYRGGNKYYPECLEIFLDTGKSDKPKIVIALDKLLSKYGGINFKMERYGSRI